MVMSIWAIGATEELMVEESSDMEVDPEEVKDMRDNLQMELKKDLVLIITLMEDHL